MCEAFEVHGNLAWCQVVSERKRRGSKPTGEHGNGVDVIELAIAFLIKSSPDIGHQDLRSLHNADRSFLEF